MELTATQTSAPPEKPAIYAQIDLENIVVHPFLKGAAAVYTVRAPDKETVNEDVAGLIPVADNIGVLVVADGLGGVPGGEQASQIAVNVITKTLNELDLEERALRDAILDGIEQANAKICALGTGAATTLALVEIHGYTVRSYHVGDAMVLVTGQRGKIKLQSIAHSPVGYAVEAGLLGEKEAVHHRDRNIVSNVVGSPEMRVEMGPPLQLAPRDTLVVASDGLADNLYVPEIVDCVRTGPLGMASKDLAAKCRHRMQNPGPEKPSHPDDLSFITFRPLPGPKRRRRPRARPVPTAASPQ